MVFSSAELESCVRIHKGDFMGRKFSLGFILLFFVTLATGSIALADGETPPTRDPKQPIDEAYTAKIRKYTTAPYFSSPLVDYLPASKSVPTPKSSSAMSPALPAPSVRRRRLQVHAPARKSHARVKVVSIGTTEEGREMIAVAVSSRKI